MQARHAMGVDEHAVAQRIGAAAEHDRDPVHQLGLRQQVAILFRHLHGVA